MPVFDIELFIIEELLMPKRLYNGMVVAIVQDIENLRLQSKIEELIAKNEVFKLKKKDFDDTLEILLMLTWSRKKPRFSC